MMEIKQIKRQLYSVVCGVMVSLVLIAASCEGSKEPIDYTDITGIYSCQEASPWSGVKNYIVEIDPVKDSESLYIISNFHNKGQNEFLYLERVQDSLWIRQQAIVDLTINGEGSIGADFRSIQLFYETDDGLTAFDFNAHYTR